MAVVVAVASIAIVAVATGATRLLSVRDAAATPAVNMNCTLIVPPNPLSAQGLAIPYQLTATNPADGPCNEANLNQTAFVQGAVINPSTGKISVYDPLVVDQGNAPAVQPVVPQVPAGSVVALWFGFNGTTLSLAGADQVPGNLPPSGAPGSPAPGSPAPGSPAAASAAPMPTMAGSQFAPALASVPRHHHRQNPAPVPTSFPTSGPPPVNPGDFAAASGAPDAILRQANCIAGENIDGQFSPFTQVAACNAVAFFHAANAAIGAGKLHVPAPGTSVDSMQCPTTRSFALIDQDQSDNVTTEYLATVDGQIAQDTAANRQQLATAAPLFNGSDNGLLDLFVDPTLGCTPWEAPNLADGGAPAPALPLDELQAAMYAGRTFSGGPAAFVPLNDPMTLDGNGQFNVDKTNTYRSLVDMSALPAGESPRAYCANMEFFQGRRLQQDINLLVRGQSPVAAMANNLFTFMAMRLQQSFTNLNCQNFGPTNDVTTTVNGAGVVVAACFLHQVAPVTPGPGNPMAGVRICPASTVPTSPSGSGQPSGAGSPSGAVPTPSPTNTTPVWWHRNHRHHWWW